MTHRTFAETIDEMVGLIEPALTGIEEGGGEANLRELQVLLRKLLIDFMRLLERNPGIEAASADLYGAASALVRDCHAGEPDEKRRRKLGRAHGPCDSRVRRGPRTRAGKLE